MTITWHGTLDEGLDLLAAVVRNVMRHHPCSLHEETDRRRDRDTFQRVAVIRERRERGDVQTPFGA